MTRSAALHEPDVPPRGLWALPAPRLAEVLPGPTLLRIDGTRNPPLLVTVLLHGNETGGWDAVRRVLGPILAAGRRPPRSVWLFVGNVAAAAAGVRHLDHQPDFNRIWQGGPWPEAAVADALLARVRAQVPFASIDLHNNTGRNPHYGCITHLDGPSRALARLFAPLAVYVRTPQTIQCRALGDLCPSVTLEAGRAGEPAGVRHPARYLEALLALDALPETAEDLDLFHTVATVRVDDTTAFAFEPPAPLVLRPDLELANFRLQPAGTVLGHWRGDRLPLVVRDESGHDRSNDWIEVHDGELRVTRDVVPAMFTRNVAVIRQDCLCYFMEHWSEHWTGCWTDRPPRG